MSVELDVDILRDAYAALNRGDIAGFVKDFDPQIVRVEFEGSPMAGEFHGIEAVKEHVTAGRSTWAEGACEPEKFNVVGDKIVVSCHIRVRLKDQTEWLEGRTGDVFTFRDGKVIEFRTFADEQEALEWAGVRDKKEIFMLRVVLGVFAGFVGWLILWIGTEKIISALWPVFGVYQKAFEEVVKNGGEFTADTTMLITHIVLGSIVSVAAGAVAAFVAGENSKAPLIAGCLLLGMGLAKAVMSWQYVPIWYHVIFTAALLPMAIIGGRLINKT